jgi:hypothetical protein
MPTITHSAAASILPIKSGRARAIVARARHNA